MAAVRRGVRRRPLTAIIMAWPRTPRLALLLPVLLLLLCQHGNAGSVSTTTPSITHTPAGTETTTEGTSLYTLAELPGQPEYVFENNVLYVANAFDIASDVTGSMNYAVALVAVLSGNDYWFKSHASAEELNGWDFLAVMVNDDALNSDDTPSMLSVSLYRSADGNRVRLDDPIYAYTGYYFGYLIDLRAVDDKEEDEWLYIRVQAPEGSTRTVVLNVEGKSLVQDQDLLDFDGTFRSVNSNSMELHYIEREYAHRFFSMRVDFDHPTSVGLVAHIGVSQSKFGVLTSANMDCFATDKVDPTVRGDTSGSSNLECNYGQDVQDEFCAEFPYSTIPENVQVILAVYNTEVTPATVVPYTVTLGNVPQLVAVQGVSASNLPFVSSYLVPEANGQTIYYIVLPYTANSTQVDFMFNATMGVERSDGEDTLAANQMAVHTQYLTAEGTLGCRADAHCSVGENMGYHCTHASPIQIDGPVSHFIEQRLASVMLDTTLSLRVDITQQHILEVTNGAATNMDEVRVNDGLFNIEVLGTTIVSAGSVGTVEILSSSVPNCPVDKSANFIYMCVSRVGSTSCLNGALWKRYDVDCEQDYFFSEYTGEVVYPGYESSLGLSVVLDDFDLDPLDRKFGDAQLPNLLLTFAFSYAPGSLGNIILVPQFFPTGSIGQVSTGPAVTFSNWYDFTPIHFTYVFSDDSVRNAPGTPGTHSVLLSVEEDLEWTELNQLTSIYINVFNVDGIVARKRCVATEVCQVLLDDCNDAGKGLSVALFTDAPEDPLRTIAVLLAEYDIDQISNVNDPAVSNQLYLTDSNVAQFKYLTTSSSTISGAEKRTFSTRTFGYPSVQSSTVAGSYAVFVYTAFTGTGTNTLGRTTITATFGEDSPHSCVDMQTIDSYDAIEFCPAGLRACYMIVDSTADAVFTITSDRAFVYDTIPLARDDSLPRLEDVIVSQADISTRSAGLNCTVDSLMCCRFWSDGVRLRAMAEWNTLAAQLTGTSATEFPVSDIAGIQGAVNGLSVDVIARTEANHVEGLLSSKSCLLLLENLLCSIVMPPTAVDGTPGVIASGSTNNFACKSAFSKLEAACPGTERAVREVLGLLPNAEYPTSECWNLAAAREIGYFFLETEQQYAQLAIDGFSQFIEDIVEVLGYLTVDVMDWPMFLAKMTDERSAVDDSYVVVQFAFPIANWAEFGVLFESMASKYNVSAFSYTDSVVDSGYATCYDLKTTGSGIIDCPSTATGDGDGDGDSSGDGDIGDGGDSPSGRGAGPVVGAVLGSLIGVACLACCFAAVMRRKKAGSEQADELFVAEEAKNGPHSVHDTEMQELGHLLRMPSQYALPGAPAAKPDIAKSQVYVSSVADSRERGVTRFEISEGSATSAEELPFDPTISQNGDATRAAMVRQPSNIYVTSVSDSRDRGVTAWEVAPATATAAGGTAAAGNAGGTLRRADKFEIPFGELQLEQELGRGNFGIVYRAQFRNSPVAVKQLIDTLDNKELLAFRAECNLMKRLRPHQNVVLLLGACTVAETPLCIVCEYIPGGSLEDHLRSNAKLTMRDVLALAKGIAAGVQHLHAENVVHRDLAARNVLLGVGNVAKVSDFGMSRSVREEGSGRGKTVSTKGPLKWMAPECISEKIYSPASDAWSYAVTMVEILTRDDPYPGRSAVQVAIMVTGTGGMPAIPEYCPNGMRLLLESCFSRDPKLRPTMADIGNTLSLLEKRDA